MLRLSLFLINLMGLCSCFNLDVDHPIIFKNPDISQNNSYFGYSVVLYSDGENGKKWIKIGAPKATYYKYKQKTHQSGIVYHCPYMKTCEIEDNFSYNSRDIFNGNGNLTDSWTGGSMDLNYKYNILAFSASKWHYFMYNSGEYTPFVKGGLFINNFQNLTLEKISPLKNPSVYPKGVSYYSRAETGFSVHFIHGKNELLVGAPVVSNYMGTVLKINNINKEQTEWKYQVMSPKGSYYEYSGYALTSGYFFNKQILYYVSGLPRGQKNSKPEGSIIYGSVLIFNFTNTKLQFKHQYKVIPKAEFYGTQFGEYFGASLAAGDLNDDGLDDLIVGAPFRTNDKHGFNHGSVYVIYGRNQGNLKMIIKNRIDGKITNGQLGTAIMFLRNINKDSDGEFAVSAPHEDTSGVVYIYTYNKLTKGLSVSQKIFGKNIYSDLRGFGMSFSRTCDIDDNHFSDIVVGSPISGHAILLRSKPTVMVYRRIEVPPMISSGNKTLSFRCCYSYSEYPEDSLVIIRNIVIDGDQNTPRFIFPNSDKNINEDRIKIDNKKEFCEDIDAAKVSGVLNYTNPLTITLNYKLPENKTENTVNPIFIPNQNADQKDTFCKTCPILGQRSLKSVTKLIMWDHSCNKKPCRSKIVIDAKFKDSSIPYTFVLGSKQSIILAVTVFNKGDPAFTPVLKIILPDGVSLRKGPVNCDNGAISKLICDLGEELEKEVSYEYELTIDESIGEESIHFLLDCVTTTKNIGDQNSSNITLQINKVADFVILGETNGFNIYTQRETSKIQNIFKIEKSGPTSVTEIEVRILVPYKVQNSKGIFHTFSDVNEYQNKNSENLPGKCQFTTDYNTNTKANTKLQKSLEIKRNLYNWDNLNLTKNSTINLTKVLYLNCTMQNVECILIKCLVGPFENVLTYAEVAVEMKINFGELEDILQFKDLIIITTEAFVFTENFNQTENSRSNYNQIENLLIIEKQQRISLWILIGSAVAGVLLLVFFTMFLGKVGFFKRKDQEKLRQLKEETLNEDRILEAMIKNELANENIDEENPLYDIFRRHKPTEDIRF